MLKRNTFVTLSIAAGMTLFSSTHVIASNEPIFDTYADIAQAAYEDSLSTAKKLDESIKKLLESPSAESMDAARAAWLAARVPYYQTEAYRFGNAIVDEWEGKVNSWPLDEGLIDYVDSSYGTESRVNDYFFSNVIANATLTVGGRTIDATQITPALLENDLHEVGGNEANVATGYHAIEFLLWGQDLNGNAAGSGKRKYTDFDASNCTNGNCDRRGEYLTAVSALLISDLEYMSAAWSEPGVARIALKNAGEIGAISKIIIGLGSLSYGELAGERMRLGLMLHDPEEEHDCFSDNTHNSLYFNALGIQNVYMGRYVRVDGRVIEGPSLSEVVAETDADLDNEMQTHLAQTIDKMGSMKERAETLEAYDQMIGEGNSDGNAVVEAAIDSLILQSETIERIVDALEVSKASITGSDNPDSPNSVFK